MKKILLILIFSAFLVNINVIYSKESKIQLQDTLFHDLKLFSDSIIENDKPGNFQLMTFNISPSAWVPLGKLSNYFTPCFELGFGLAFQFTQRLRLEYTIHGRFIDNSKPIQIKNGQTTVFTSCESAMNVGGWVATPILKNDNLIIELSMGGSWESISTKFENPFPKNEKDKKLKVSTFGISVGVNAWLVKINNQNFGFNINYNYAPFYIDDILVTKLGGNYLTVGLTTRLGFDH